MGYLFLFIALLCGCVKGYCGKKTSGAVSELRDAMLANIIRMLLCILIGLVITVFQGDAKLLKADFKTLLLSAFSGAATAVFVVSWLIAVKKGAYMTIDVFLLLGTVIPIGVSAAVLGEQIEINQVTGFLILTAAVVIMCSYNNSIKEKMSIASLGILVLCGAASGFAGLSQKLFAVYAENSSNAVFNLYTYVFSAVVLIICYFISGIKTKDEKKNTVANIKSVIWYIPVMALCLFLNSYFMTTAAAYLPAVLLYPLCQGAGLIMSSLMSAAFFKEKITGKCVAGLLLAFAGLVVMNML